MSEVRQRKNKSSNKQQNVDPDKLTKEEEAVAKYLRFKLATKKANLMNVKVDYFVGSKAVDLLMQSNWATGNKKTQVLFTNRQSCVSFLQILLAKNLYHRATKIYKEDKETGSGKSAITSGTNKTPESTPKPKKRAAADSTPKVDDKKGGGEIKRKFKLELHDDQRFVDGNEPYVWVYDPTPASKIFIGLLLVVGSIAVCLFPLWPPSVRQGVYYVSVAGASCLGFILSLAVVKYILFGVFWVVTFGKIHFWLLPNLTEDVGFVQSFLPIYDLKIKSSSSTTTTTDSTASTNETSEPTTTKITRKESKDDIPLDEQLMNKFDEEIEKGEEEEEEVGEEEDDDDDDASAVNGDDDYELVNNEDVKNE